MVVSEWIKAFYHRGEPPELYYWNAKGGIEVDLIVDRNGRLYPIEIKATSTLLPAHTASLRRWAALAEDLASGALIVANISEPFTLQGCRAVSWGTGLDLV
jgi:predicted AAA+ superfamily ATPase